MGRPDRHVALITLAVGAGCGRAPTPAPWDPADPPRANVLVVVLDDVGTDKVGAYAAHPSPPRTPNLDALAADGVRFRHAVAYPSCSPSRTAMLTGHHPRTWGVVRWIRPWTDRWSLTPDAYTVPDLLHDADPPWHASFAGKWHLVHFDDPEAASHPQRHGWDFFAGSLANLGNSVTRPEEPLGYHRWEKSVDGALALVERYPTTDTVDDGIARMAAAPEPWLVWVSLNAAHEPIHDPPPELLDPTEPPTHRVDAAVEALDRELGRLFAAAPPGTAIVVVSDNGTAPEGVEAPGDPDRSKGTVYEGGVNVPLIVAGPWVTRPGVSDQLVHVADLFATLGDNAGVDPRALPLPIAGRSWLPLLADPALPGHDVVFTAAEHPNGPGPWSGCRAARSVTAKWVRCDEGGDGLYQLAGDGDGPDRSADAPPELAEAGRRLEAALTRWEREVVFAGDR